MANTKVKDEETALVPISDYAIMSLGSGEIPELLNENIGEELDIFSLPQVRVPAGGGDRWSVPSLDGDDERMEAITGVIIAWQDARQFYLVSFDESGGGPPDCSAVKSDGWHSYGKRFADETPSSHNCETCQHNQFGSAKGGKGRGKACGEGRRLFVLPPDRILPLCIWVPTMSVKAIRTYNMGLVSRREKYYTVVTRLGLDQDKNADKITYSFIRPSMAGSLTSEQKAAFTEFNKAFLPILMEAGVRADRQQPQTADSSFSASDDLEEIQVPEDETMEADYTS